MILLFLRQREQTTEIIGKMDVVLYAKNISNPDLNVLENSLVKVASESDEFVEVKDKIIVALTQGERNIRTNNNPILLSKSKEAWARLGVPGSRIIPVYTHAELEKSSPTKVYPEIVDTNMEFLKRTVSECVVESRYKFTEKRLKGLRKKIDVNVKALKGYIKEDYEIDFDEENGDFDENEGDEKLHRDEVNMDRKSINEEILRKKIIKYNFKEIIRILRTF